MTFKLQNLHRGELIALAGAAALAFAVLVLSAYQTTASNPNSKINNHHGGLHSIWHVHPIMRWLLLAAAVAPFVLAWIILREHELSWPRGQVTAIVAIAAIGLLFYTGIIAVPGEPSATVSLDVGWFVAFGGAVLMLVGSFMRTEETAAVRKPPGVL